MNKSELIDKVATDTGLPKNKAKDAVEAFIKAVGEGLMASGKVSVTGLGNFTKTVRPARAGRNPKTGETIQIEEKVAVKFKAASQFTTSLG